MRLNDKVRSTILEEMWRLQYNMKTNGVVKLHCKILCYGSWKLFYGVLTFCTDQKVLCSLNISYYILNYLPLIYVCSRLSSIQLLTLNHIQRTRVQRTTIKHSWPVRHNMFCFKASELPKTLLILYLSQTEASTQKHNSFSERFTPEYKSNYSI